MQTQAGLVGGRGRRGLFGDMCLCWGAAPGQFSEGLDHERGHRFVPQRALLGRPEQPWQTRRPFLALSPCRQARPWRPRFGFVGRSPQEGRGPRAPEKGQLTGDSRGMGVQGAPVQHVAQITLPWPGGYSTRCGHWAPQREPAQEGEP